MNLKESVFIDHREHTCGLASIWLDVNIVHTSLLYHHDDDLNPHEVTTEKVQFKLTFNPLRVSQKCIVIIVVEYCLVANFVIVAHSLEQHDGHIRWMNKVHGQADFAGTPDDQNIGNPLNKVIVIIPI